MLRSWRTIVLLAVTSAAIVAQEILLTRLLSVTTWYSLAFIVINLAMVGLAAGSIEAARADRSGEPVAPWIARRLLVMSGSLLAADVITVWTPLSFEADLLSFGSMLLLAAANMLPFIAGGSVIARLMSRASESIPALYAVDLVSAAAGALLPLALLGPLSDPSATALLAACAAACAWIADSKVIRGAAVAFLVAIATIVLTEATPAGLTLHQAKGEWFRAPRPPLLEAWNPLSYVYARPFFRGAEPILWAASPLFRPSGRYLESVARIDGDAWTPIYQYRDLSQLRFLRYDVVAAAHVLRPRGTACVIGAGGGRDILTALEFGHPRVFAVEINPLMLDLLRRVADVSPLIRDPRVKIVIGDGRAVLARSGVQCSVLQASLIDTWAATSAGAFAHTEGTLYTREAWSLFLKRVEPDGILTFSRWYDPRHVNETARLISLAMASLLDRGAANPRDHIAVIASGRIATILVSPAPFSDADRAAIESLGRDLEFQILVQPGRRSDDPLTERLLEARSAAALARAGRPWNLDTSAPTDDRPFFFHLLAPSAWLHPRAAIDRLVSAHDLTMSGGVILGNITATVGILLMLTAVSLLGAILLGPTIVASLRSSQPALPGLSAWIYFGALGAGFMITEIVLIQRMHVVLGHPTWSLIVVLSSLLVATGIGSAMSERFLRTRGAVSVVAAIAAALLIALPILIIDPLAHRTLEASFALRAFWTAACAAAPGLFLGTLFPAGLRFTNREPGVPAALAINGITSVLGGGAAVMLSVAFGIPVTFAIAGACYLIAAIAGPLRWHDAA
ncbi:MAG TPA: hypothetical protein VL284_14615 [Thermoanaerobaculia bacterium]|nr:hypothetical protein [Thermoanaerobaculia bacterium]